MEYPLGVLGGSGFYKMEGLEIEEERAVETPYGQPSDKLVLGKVEGQPVAFLARHGRAHQYNPTHVPYQANIWALKSIGVKWLVSISAVGSLKEEIVPLHVVLPDQLIDRTRSRPNSMFDPVAVHVGFADPYCPILSKALTDAAKGAGIATHEGGTYVCMEGPLFSTRAESNLYRSWGASIVGMTALPEAKFAREAEIAYAALCFATDYDCWHTEDVSVEMIIERLHTNAAHAAQAIRNLAAGFGKFATETSASHLALDTALLTQVEDYPRHTLDRVRLILKRVRPGI
jgi:5'-methylthioadenosine phosphorylase